MDLGTHNALQKGVIQMTFSDLESLSEILNKIKHRDSLA